VKSVLGQVSGLRENASADAAGPANDFKFSKDIMDRGLTPFAVYIFHNGYGYVDGVDENIYDFNLNGYVSTTGKAEAIGKAYMQMLFNDYNNR